MARVVRALTLPCAACLSDRDTRVTKAAENGFRFWAQGTMRRHAEVVVTAGYLIRRSVL